MVCGADWRERGPPFSRGRLEKESVMAGLDPAIHVFGRSKRKDMDAREFFLEDALSRFCPGMTNCVPQFVTSSR
jgi:hypothetical protein